MASLAEVIEWKYGFVASTKQEKSGKVVISEWRHATISKPDAAQIVQDAVEYTAWEQAQPPEKTLKEEVEALKSRVTVIEAKPVI